MHGYCYFLPPKCPPKMCLLKTWSPACVTIGKEGDLQETRKGSSRPHRPCPFPHLPLPLLKTIDYIPKVDPKVHSIFGHCLIPEEKTPRSND